MSARGPRPGAALVGAIALLVGLVGATPAAAALRPVPSGSAVGDGVPLKAYASLSPTVDLFGDAVTARIAVVADTKWVDPARLRVTADFRPYRPVHAPRVVLVRSGRFEQKTWTWTLRCITSPCVPRTPPTDTLHVFRFPQARIDYLAADGTRAYGIRASWPAVQVVSQVSPGVVAYLARNNALKWSYRLAPVPAAGYRISPQLLFWLALGLAGALAVAAAVLARGWWRALRPPAPAAAPAPPATTLERALAVLVWARQQGDETLQRKALERVADELDVHVHDLSETAHALAWSPAPPEDADVERVSAEALSRRRSPAPPATPPPEAASPECDSTDGTPP